MLHSNNTQTKFNSTSHSAHKMTKSVGFSKANNSLSPTKNTMRSHQHGESLAEGFGGLTLYKTCNHNPDSYDFDNVKAYENAAESLTSNKTVAEQTARRIKENLMENRDNTNKLKQDMKKMETDFNNNMDMMVNGMELRFREFSAKLKVECSFADKEFALLNKECENLYNGWLGFGDEVNKSDKRQSELEEFCGVSHNQILTAYGTMKHESLMEEIQRGSLQPVEE